MKITAKLNYFRMSSRKIRLVADIVRNMDVKDAENQLKFSTKKVAGIILKLLNSAIANAQHNFGIEKDNLFISQIQVNSGTPLKRWRARAMGRAASILKRTSHIELVLETKKEVKAQKKEGGTEKVSAPLKKFGAPSVAEKVPKPEKPVFKPKPVLPARPYGASPDSKRKFFSRQTFGNVKKIFRRKSF